MIDKKMGSSLSLVSKKYRGFTLAEILLSLSIIGIVAAIALPSLLGNVHERAFETQKKALYTRFSQAIPLLPSLNGYGTLEGTLSEGTKGQEGYVPQNVTVDTAAESFIRDGLSKVMKITNICDNEHLTDCGLPDKIIPIDGSSAINLSSISKLSGLNIKIVQATVDAGTTYSVPFEQLDTKASAFETVNGESILVYYNPNCEPDLGELIYGSNTRKENSKSSFAQLKMCANFIYDLNGKKGPNTVGKDIGVITALYSTDPVIVAPNPYPKNIQDSIESSQVTDKCKELGSEAKAPNINELSSMFYNMKLFSMYKSHYFSSSQFSANRLWIQSFASGLRWLDKHQYSLRCIKR